MKPLELNTIFQKDLSTLLILLQNPRCQRLLRAFQQGALNACMQNTYDAKASFFRWACTSQQLSKLFGSPIVIRSIGSDIHTLQDGEAVCFPQRKQQIHGQELILAPDLVLHHKGELVLVEFCCHPYRGGQTQSSFVQKARYKAALYHHFFPFLQSDQCFLVLHQWNTLTLHQEDISAEKDFLQHNFKDLSKGLNETTADFNLLPSCRLSCPYFARCELDSIQRGDPTVWSHTMPNFLGDSSVFHAWALLCGEATPKDAAEKSLKERLSNIQTLYDQLFPAP